MMSRSAYASTDEPLDSVRAWEVLRPVWEEIVLAFARKGFKEPGRARVEVDAKWHDSCRHHAATQGDGRLVGYAPQTADLSPSSIRAIMAHEAGHIVDLSNPGVYWFRPAQRVRLREGCRVVSVLDLDPSFQGPALFRFEELPTKGLNKHLREWGVYGPGGRDRDDDEIEFVADALAEYVLGQPLGYVGSPECLIQAVGEGIPRPKGLR